MGLLAQVLEVAVGQAGAFCGHLHAEAVGGHRAALPVHQREIVEVSGREGGGHLAR